MIKKDSLDIYNKKTARVSCSVWSRDLEREVSRSMASGRVVDDARRAARQIARAGTVMPGILVGAAVRDVVQLLRQDRADLPQAGDQLVAHVGIAVGDRRHALQLDAAALGRGEEAGRMLAREAGALDQLAEEGEAIDIELIGAERGDLVADALVQGRLHRRRIGGVEGRGRLPGAERGARHQAGAAGDVGAVANGVGRLGHGKELSIGLLVRMCPSPNTLVYYLDYVNSYQKVELSSDFLIKIKKAPLLELYCCLVIVPRP